MTHLLFRHLAVVLLCLTTVLGSRPAHAGGAADAAISNVHLGVLDLTPADSLAAGFDVLSAMPSLYASLNAAPAEYYAAGSPGPRVPATVAVAFGASGSTASTSGALADVAAHATGAANLGEYGYAAASGNQEVRLTLHPYSVLTIAGHLSSQATRHDDVEHYDVVGMTSVSIVDENGYTYTQRTRQSLSYADWPAQMAIEEDFTLAYANGGAAAQAVTLYFQTWSNVTRIAAPVPEPSMAALLAAGALCLAGWDACRRSRAPKRQRRPVARAASASRSRCEA